MKTLLSILMILLASSCIKKTTEIRYYPTDELSNEYEIEHINLDSTYLNFKGITNLLSKNDWSNKKTIIEIKDGLVTRSIIPHTYAGCFFHPRNILKIKTDSILLNEGIPISQLKPVLKSHYVNINKNYPHEKSVQIPLIEVTIDSSKTGIELKDFLLKITRTFDEINSELKDSLELRLYFDYFRQLPPPPPPSMNNTDIIQLKE